MAEPKQGGDANAFIQEYTPIAQRIGQQLNVDPRILLAQFGMETGWGSSVVPGTYNLGNIKSAGKGVEATDNATKSKDRYLKFEDPDVFADYYAQYIKRQFPEVVGSGADVNAFTKALRPGTQGGYAEDKDYGSKLNNAFSLVTSRMESNQPKQDDEFGFGSGETEAQRIAKEPPPRVVEREGAVNKEDALLAGAGFGYLAGKGAEKVKMPTSPKLAAAVERLAKARDDLDEVRGKAGYGVSMDDLNNELRMRQAAATQAAEELRLAQAELTAASSTTPARTTASAAPDAPPGRASGPKVPGASAASNYAKAMAGEMHQLPDTLLSQVQDYTKSNPKGAHAVIQKDLANLKRITELGGGDYALSGSGPGQLMVPSDVSAEKTAALDAELNQRQAADAAERTRIAQEAEARRIAAERRVAEARQARAQTGTSVGETSQQAKEARAIQKEAQKAQSVINTAEKAVKRAEPPKPGALGQVGAATAKIAPKALGVISGAATGMAAAEAIDRIKQGDYSGAVLPTIEATFGIMSMLPPGHPILLLLRGIGTVGGTALGAYELGKAGKEVYDARQQN